MSRPLESLILFKRHSANCAVNKSRIPKKKREFFMECGCQIWIRGRTPAGDVVPRQSTGSSDLKQAEAMRDAYVRQGRAASGSGLPVVECVERYLRLREQDLDERTLAQHRLALERLRSYLENRGIFYVQEIKADHLGRAIFRFDTGRSRDSVFSFWLEGCFPESPLHLHRPSGKAV